jgi:biopolymer transport protein TolR
MAMQTSGQAQINVTPLIDVLLVLLIIFMAISPIRSIGLGANIPQPSTENVVAPADDLVVSINADGSIHLNSRELSRDELLRTLRQALALEPSRAVFLKGAKELEYQEVAAVLDTVRETGAQRIGLMTDRGSR